MAGGRAGRHHQQSTDDDDGVSSHSAALDAVSANKNEKRTKLTRRG